MQKKAEDYMAKSTGPGDPLFEDLSANQSQMDLHSPADADYGVHITFPNSVNFRDIW